MLKITSILGLTVLSKLTAGLCLFLFGVLHAEAQIPFGNRCLGNWSGTMYLYNHGQLRDSVAVTHVVAATANPQEWTWRTDYLSDKMPMTKDYLLRLRDPAKGIYEVDERDGIVLYEYLFADKIYSVFETQGVLLTSTYELRGKELIFEVTSGKKISTDSEVISYTVEHLQRVVLTQKDNPQPR